MHCLAEPEAPSVSTGKLSSNPGSPIFRSLENLLRFDEAREDYGVSEVLQFVGSSQWGLDVGSRKFSVVCKELAVKREKGL